MRNQLKAPEAGRPAYQHPQRSSRSRPDFFDERLDDFGAMVILLNLAVVDERLWAEYHDQHDDRLLISEQDLRNPSASPLLTALTSRPGPVARLAGLLTDAACGDLTAVPSFEALVANPEVQPLLDGSTPAKPATRQRARPRLPPGVLSDSPVDAGCLPGRQKRAIPPPGPPLLRRHSGRSTRRQLQR
jgi:hypothetical protein